MATTTKKATSEKKTATKTSTKKSESIETKVVKPEPVAADRTAELEKLLKEQLSSSSLKIASASRSIASFSSVTSPIVLMASPGV